MNSMRGGVAEYGPCFRDAAFWPAVPPLPWPIERFRHEISVLRVRPAGAKLACSKNNPKTLLSVAIGAVAAMAQSLTTWDFFSAA